MILMVIFQTTLKNGEIKMNKEHALSLIKEPHIIPMGDGRYRINIVIDGTTYSTDDSYIEFIEQQYAVLIKILEGIKS